MTRKILDIRLFGACEVRGSSGASEVTGAKNKALFVLLATAPEGRRTRAFLQDMLWGESCFEGGRQNLRRALSDVKKMLGDDFGELVVRNNAEIALRLDLVQFVGRAGQGEFLEGLDIRDEGFNAWMRAIRVNPDQLFSLFSGARQAPATAMTPAIAVLPFQLILGDERHRILGDWLAENVSRTLSRSNLLTVISHLSSRAAAQRLIDLSHIRESLGIDYCVSGSIRAFGDEVILDADFLDAASGRILWTRQFTGDLRGFLSKDANGMRELVRAIGRAIASEAMDFALARTPMQIEDRRLLIGGVSLMHRPSLNSFARARELIEEAISRAPASAESHAWLGKWYVLSVFNGWSVTPDHDTQRATDCSARALDIDPESAFCLTIDGFIQSNLLRRPDIASERYAAAIDINPNESLSWLFQGAVQAFSDAPEKAVVSVERARNLSPLDPFEYYYNSLSASAYLANGDYARALELAECSAQTNNRHTSTLRVKIIALQQLGQGAEARAAAKNLMDRQPDFTISSYLKNHPAGRFKAGHTMAVALRAAGIPE